MMFALDTKSRKDMWCDGLSDCAWLDDEVPLDSPQTSDGGHNHICGTICMDSL